MRLGIVCIPIHDRSISKSSFTWYVDIRLYPVVPANTAHHASGPT
jgi:hypothetical protein